TGSAYLAACLRRERSLWDSRWRRALDVASIHPREQRLSRSIGSTALTACERSGTARHATELGREQPWRDGTCLHARRDRRRACAHCGVQRAGHVQHRDVVTHVDVPREHALRSGARKLREAQLLICFANAINLQPRACHELPLQVLDDERTEPGGYAVAGILIQHVEPWGGRIRS